jgi:hypothetical protein
MTQSGEIVHPLAYAYGDLTTALELAKRITATDPEARRQRDALVGAIGNAHALAGKALEAVQ